MRNRILKLDASDNVLIALTDLNQREQIAFSGNNYTLVSDIPAKHKFATEDLAIGADVIMYGVIVGRAVKPVLQGERLTTSNIQHQAASFHQQSQGYRWAPPDVSRWKQQTFLGYRRSDGQVGTRNYWLVVPLVFCENRNIIVGGDPRPARVFKNIDGIKFLVHQGGCGGTREDSNNLCGLIAGYINHPNVAGVTVLSLGCQHAQIGILRQQLRKRAPNFDKPLFILEQQQSGTEFAMLSEAIQRTFLGLVECNQAERTPAALSHLCVGLKCGGSDGFSGLSANPAIGHTADLLIALGGRTILSEFPELCGVEQELINRSARSEISDRFVELMRDYQARAKSVGSGFEMNPSPGNIRDGLITDAMKSAGAAKKGGTSPVTAVLDYPEYSTEPGLNLQCTPGNDVECVTAQVGAGASVVLFTTGLGTPTGNPITPVVKLSTNSELAERMSDIIDIDTGSVISGEKTIEQTGEAILDFVIRVANGDVRTRAELKGQEDFIPWKRGVSL